MNPAKEPCVAVPEILLPAEGTDMAAWAVIACDQHTSDAAYWSALDALVGNKPSTLRLTLPEIYLGKEGCAARICSISETMRSYAANGVFRKLPKGFVFVERSTPYRPRRVGIVLAVDLESYSYQKGSRARIRATEATILERIPPRLQIRAAATIEFPHVMLLYEDAQNTVLRAAQSRLGEVLYDFDLNMGGGHVKGTFIGDTQPVVEAFEKLVSDDLLFMVGDGNHSLATAKAAWDAIKDSLTEEERRTHPARYALAEAVNIYDDGIYFEGIHRIVKGVDAQKFAAAFSAFGSAEGALYVGGCRIPVGMAEEVPAAVAETDRRIAAYIAEHGGSVDYIHGEQALADLTARDPHCVGVFLPKMDKSELFGLVKKNGSLPRKTFSMGESEEKRYYIEGKEIRI